MTKRPPDQHLWGRTLRQLPKEAFGLATASMTIPPFEVWRSRDFLVQVFDENGQVRITVNRTHQPNGKDWAGGISWDELQQIKAEIGRADQWAVEIYPPDEEIVNLAVMRHLWLLPGEPDYGWTRDREPSDR